jgi:xanthine dehydrogenase accessory factor
MSQEIIKAAARCAEENIPAALATVVETTGSTPGRVGAKMLVFADGKIMGTVGGGGLEAAVIEEARHAIKSGRPRLSGYSLTPEQAGGLGMVCGGKATVYIEPVLPKPHLVIAGGGHIAKEIYWLAKRLNFEVSVIDDREEFANKERFPDADRLVVSDIAETLRSLPVHAQTYIAIVTRGHKYDEEALHAVLGTPAAYIGMIGSRRKIKTVYSSLENKGVDPELLKQVYAPIGLDLGGNEPAEIALAIMAQILQVQNRGKADRL